MSWTQNKTSPESLAILGILSEKCAELGGPISKALYQLVLDKDYLTLATFELDYGLLDVDRSNISDYIYARQILGLYQKAEFIDLGIDREAAAAVRFVESELLCRETNYRIKNMAFRPQDVDSDVAVALSYAQQKIATVLGDVPSFDEFNFSFGPGANTNVKGRHSNPRVKLGAPLVCSTDLTPTVASFLSETPLWTALHSYHEDDEVYRVNVGVVPGKVIFVPKNAKTDRTICIEPLLNSFFQKGVGAYIRSRLLRSGIDLTNQQRNQDLARMGSNDGSLATVDISMASDCISRELVWNLLPLPWAELLSALRTSQVTVPESVIRNGDRIGSSIHDGVLRLEKFSSMGNGYTFELESLLFYGICSGVCRALSMSQRYVSVYGDDIIVPAGAFQLLQKVLNFCGFALNKSKSFATGPFRESCGADYLNGFDIRPAYVKTLISNADLFVLHNWFVRSGEYELAAVVYQLCHPAYVLTGPDGFGDGHLIGTFKLRVNRESKRRGWDGGYFDTYTRKPRSFKGLSSGDAVLPAYSIYVRSGYDSPTDPNVVRGSDGYAKVSIYTLGLSIFSRKA